ncbi:MAG: rhomboid family intramembrane serine protease, partial [Myxococcota bacterium]
LGPQASAELERLQREVASYPSTAEGWMPRTTGVLIAILLGTHLWVEVLGTGERFRDLVSYGALLIDPKTAPWPATSLFTVFTANYLHINAVHLGVNVVGLWLFGRQLETEWGWRRFLIVYLLTGPLALTTVLFSYTVISGPPIVFVGASGAVMGVLGATLAVHMARWRTTAHPMRKGSIGTIIAIVLLQVVFDMTHPQVSLGGHLAGAVWGLLLATVLDRIRSR